VRPHVKKDDLFLGHQHSQQDAVVVGQADGLHIGQLASQLVELQMGLKRVPFQIAQHVCELGVQFRVLFRKALG